MYCSTGEEVYRPLPGKVDKAKDEVDGLEYRHRFDSTVEVFCQKVEEEFRPEEAM